MTTSFNFRDSSKPLELPLIYKFTREMALRCEYAKKSYLLNDTCKNCTEISRTDKVFDHVIEFWLELDIMHTEFLRLINTNPWSVAVQLLFKVELEILPTYEFFLIISNIVKSALLFQLLPPKVLIQIYSARKLRYEFI